jgi:hypothetical protein
MTINKDITESSSDYTYNTAAVTAVSGNGTTITYTAVNTFSAGDVIDVTGSNITGYNVTDATVATASATQFTVTNSATGTNSSSSVVAFTASSVTPNIDAVIDLSYTASGTNFDLTDVAYDVSLANIPFILKVDNQNPYRRETAQYKKDQFDNSAEPGEQSLTGWWVRSQTSWHSGAGIEFYEPGTQPEIVSHKFHDSRGVDVWTVGEARLHKKVFHAYSSASGAGNINAATGNDGTNDVLVSGDAKGILRKVTLNGNSSASTETYVHTGTSFPQGHDGTNFPFTSVTTSGGKYYATCSGAIHRGTVGTLDSDVVFARHDGGDTAAFVKYAKGFVFFGEDNILNLLDTTQSDTNAHSGPLPAGKQFDSRTHIDSTFIWNDITGGTTHIYASGNSGNNGEIFKIPFDGAPTSTNNGSLLPDLSSSTVTVTLPDGETIKAIHYYLGYLAVGTNKGVRICQVNQDGDLILGPLLVETSYAVNGFTERGSYLYAATKVLEGANTNGILIRIDLSQQFNDGTFAYAYDLEYESSLDGDSSECTEVYNLNDRLVMVIQEVSDITKGELQVEHTTDYRTSGWLQTGKIRYATVEPKFFKYLQTRGLVASGDSITVQTIDSAGNEYDIISLDSLSLGENVGLAQPVGGQEFIAIKYTFNNGSPITDYPVLQSYQLKAIPGVPRQRLYQFPLSCYDIEMDKYNAQFGYKGRAYEVIQILEELEVKGDFVTIKDYRTEESFQGVIEEVRFTNESSPDKDSNGFGGLLLVTVRKL